LPPPIGRTRWRGVFRFRLIGLVGQYFPQFTYFAKATHQNIKEKGNNINNCPIKRLNFENLILVMNPLFCSRQK
jgi:hypothetical protein